MESFNPLDITISCSFITDFLLSFETFFFRTSFFPPEKASSTPVMLGDLSIVNELSQAWFGILPTLDFYKVCVKNENKVFINNIEIALPYEKDPEAGAMEVSIGNSSKPIYVPIYKDENHKCGDKIFHRRELNEVSIVYRVPNAVPLVVSGINKDQKGKGVMTLTGDAYIDASESYIRYYTVWSEIVLKFIMILVGWIIIVLSIIESCRRVKKSHILED